MYKSATKYKARTLQKAMKAARIDAARAVRPTSPSAQLLIQGSHCGTPQGRAETRGRPRTASAKDAMHATAPQRIPRRGSAYPTLARQPRRAPSGPSSCCDGTRSGTCTPCARRSISQCGPSRLRRTIRATRPHATERAGGALSAQRCARCQRERAGKKPPRSRPDAAQSRRERHLTVLLSSAQLQLRVAP